MEIVLQTDDRRDNNRQNPCKSTRIYEIDEINEIKPLLFT